MNTGLHAKLPDYEGKVVSLKLMTADHRIIELIAKVVGTTEKSIWLQNPQLLQAMHVKNPKTGEIEEAVGMVNFMVTGDQSEPVEIQRSLIMATSLTKKEAADEYNRANSSLVMAKPPGLIS